MARISLDDLSFRYPGAPDDTLSGLNLDIEHGEAHALLGASGAGKTTLLNLLSGLLVPTRGALRFNGEDVSTVAGCDRKIAQVFQFPVLYESMSVADNLAFPLRTRGHSRADIASRVDAIAQELGLGALQRSKPPSLSLFEKQLVAVGKALVRPDVSVVLLDEPLTAVEPQVKWRLRQTLRRAQHDLGVTMIYVTHDQTEALTFADRVSVLTAGGILQTGTPEAIYQTPEHEFVGHFVGSPGMNFVPAAVVGAAGADRIGFRPEWSRLLGETAGATHLQGQVVRTRPQGTRDGAPFGLAMVATEHGEVAVRGSLVAGDRVLAPADRARIEILRHVAFAAGQRITGGMEQRA